MIPEAAVEAAVEVLWDKEVTAGDVRAALEAAAPHMRAGARDGERVLSRVPYYQARLIDGSVWIETKSLDELHEHCEGKDVTIQYLEVLTVETSWKPYPKYE